MLVDMNYLIFFIIVDNTIEASYKILLYSLYRNFSFSAVFIFNINRKTTIDLKKHNNFIPKASFIRGKES